jgi:hypothetical protein
LIDANGNTENTGPSGNDMLFLELHRGLCRAGAEFAARCWVDPNQDEIKPT